MKSCYDKAVELLGVAPHFRRQLGAKLLRRGYDRESVEAALDRLAEQGYLDDEKAATGFVASRLARGGIGKVRLAAELGRKGAESSAVEAALAALPDDDLPATREAASRWLARGGGDLRSLGRHLDRKGFSRRAIVTVLGESSTGEGDDLGPETDDDDLS